MLFGLFTIAMKLNGFLFFRHPQVEHFDEHREENREIKVAFGHFAVRQMAQMRRFRDQHEADQEQKRHAEHLDCGVVVDKFRDRAAEKHHDDHAKDNSKNHDPQIIGQTNGCQDRIERKNDVDQCDLDNDRLEGSGALFDVGCVLFWVAFELVVDLGSGFVQQKNAATEQDYRLARHRAVQIEEIDVKPWLLHRDEPSDAKKQDDAQQHGEHQPDIPGFGLVFFGQSVRDDRQKNDVVDPQNNLQKGKGQQGDPNFCRTKIWHF